MNDKLMTGRQWALRLNGALWFALLFFALVGLVVVALLPGWMIAIVLAAGVILGGLVFLLRWLFKRGDADYSSVRSFVACAAGGILAATGLASLPIYYLANWVQTGPTALPLITLSNGTKTVVFQGMQHVASEDFYKSVVYDLEKALSDGYTLFYEGVQPVANRPDLNEWFNKTLRGDDGGTDLSTGYLKLADTCGLKFQLTYFQPLTADMSIRPTRHVIADVSYLDMKNEYDRLLHEDPGFAAAIAARAAKPKSSSKDEMETIIHAMSNATSGQKKLAGIVCRGVMGMSVAGKIGDSDDPSQRVILDFRNRSLARTVAESPADKIYITYGAAHFPGFLADLQKLDPKFRVASVKGVRPMAFSPEADVSQFAELVRGK